MRAFSLLEMLVAVAIVGVVAALAVPSLLPAVQIETLTAQSHAVGGFLASARLTAMSQRRCVRVRIASATAPGTLVTERLNSFDCEDAAAGPLIDGGDARWVELGRYVLDNDALQLALSPAPPDTAGEIRFRPSGRTFSADANVDDDDGVLTITHPTLAGGNVVHVLVDSPGLVCVLPRGVVPPGSGTTRSCP